LEAACIHGEAADRHLRDPRNLELGASSHALRGRPGRGPERPLAPI
jgi:hypothetical protein